MNATATNETPVSVRMTVAEWNQVIGILSEHPFRVVAPLIGKIHGQAMTALGGQPVPDGPLIHEGKVMVWRIDNSSAVDALPAIPAPADRGLLFGRQRSHRRCGHRGRRLVAEHDPRGNPQRRHRRRDRSEQRGQLATARRDQRDHRGQHLAAARRRDDDRADFLHHAERHSGPGPGCLGHAAQPLEPCQRG